MESDVQNHYNSDNLTECIKTALKKAGKIPDHLTIKDLVPIDQLHTGGAKATLDLFDKSGLKPGASILDAGCGIGGTSRLLAEKFNHRVTGIDLADQFIDAAQFLTRSTGLEKSVDFRQGSVLDLPFESGTFDAVISQHILMNIEDKPRAIKEFSRVLKPGGLLLLHEIVKGEKNDARYPVPWAAEPDISFLTPWPQFCDLFESSGFSIIFQIDDSPIALRWWEKAKTAAQRTTVVPPLHPRLVFGENALEFGKNMFHNFSTQSIGLMTAVLKK